MKHPFYFIVAITLFFVACLQMQEADVEQIRSEVKRSDIELNIHFLSSDELRGRGIGTLGLDVAARYIASWFLSNRIATPPGYKSFFQTFDVVLRDSSSVASQNVIGMVGGTDPDLKDEYILLSAHYDHLGVGPATADGDSIYNGARDNAIGVATIMAAGKYFANHPPKRSIIIAAWTAEELGLIGSRWFAEHPAVPLDQIVFNLNIDGAGYNDTTKVTVVGLERTTAEPMLESASEAFGLKAIPSPVPELNLFNRSDNVHFARNGIPAPTFSPGFTAFDEDIQRYYHQATDESETINFEYVTNYVRAYILSAQKIANAEKAPFWVPGDEYEAVGKRLFGENQ